MRYARVLNDVVVQIVVDIPDFTIAERFHPDFVGTLHECGGEVIEGWILSGGQFSAPPENETPPDPLPDEISRRQFFQYLSVLAIISQAEALAAMQGGAIPTPLQVIIDQLPTDDDKFNAQMFVVGAQNFNRLHWLTDKVRQAMEWTGEQRDDFWRGAAKL